MDLCRRAHHAWSRLQEGEGGRHVFQRITVNKQFYMKKYIFWILFAAVLVLLLVFFFKDTLPFILGGVAALIIRWAYNRWIARE